MSVSKIQLRSKPHTDHPDAVPPGYKRTDVGVIPQDWDVKLLPGVCLFRSGKAHEQYISEFGQYVCVNSKFISTDGKVQKYCTANFCSARKDDILMVMSDLPNGKALAKTYLVEEANLYAVNQRVCALTAYADDPRYLFYVLNRNKYFLKFDDGVNQTHLLNDVFAKCPVALPPTTFEQRAIAAALSDVDSLIEALDKLIAKKRAIKQATMQQLLTCKTRLPGFTGGWEDKTLGQVCKIVSGGTPSTAVKTFWDGTIPWCTPTDITGCDGKYLHATSRNITHEGLQSSAATLLPAGSILLCTRATIGELKIAAQPVATNQGFKSLICNPDSCNEFVYYKLSMMKWQLIEKGVGSTFLEVSKTDVASLEFFSPRLDEQQAIAVVLSDMDAEIAALERRHDKTKAIKQGMMQALLTGRVRLVKPEAET